MTLFEMRVRNLARTREGAALVAGRDAEAAALRDEVRRLGDENAALREELKDARKGAAAPAAKARKGGAR